jgi:hypothetical protein
MPFDYSGANAFLDAFGYFANAQTAFRTVTIKLAGMEGCWYVG